MSDELRIKLRDGTPVVFTEDAWDAVGEQLAREAHEPDGDEREPRVLSAREEDFAAAEHFAHLDRIQDQ